MRVAARLLRLFSRAMAAAEGPLPLDQMVDQYLTDLQRGMGDVYLRLCAAQYKRMLQVSDDSEYVAALKERMAAQMAGPLSDMINHARHIPLALRPRPRCAGRRRGTSRKLPPSGLRRQCG